jgi:hypothetical protein
LTAIVSTKEILIGELISVNTEKLEEQAEAIKRISVGSLDVSSWPLFLILPVALQIVFSSRPKFAALLSGVLFISIAVLQKVLFSPLQTVQWLWNFKASLINEFEAHTRFIGYILGMALLSLLIYIAISVGPGVWRYISNLKTRRLNDDQDEVISTDIEKNTDIHTT